MIIDDDDNVRQEHTSHGVKQVVNFFSIFDSFVCLFVVWMDEKKIQRKKTNKFSKI